MAGFYYFQTEEASQIDLVALANESMTSSIASFPHVVSIAGVDPSGGAGVLADIKTFSALGAYGCGVIAALTAQNTRVVSGIHQPPTDFLRLQIDTLFADLAIHAIKIGMLGNAETIATVAERLAHWQGQNIVLDTVMVAKSGDRLLSTNAIHTLREALLPLSLMITPNLPEAGVLLEQRPPETLKEMYRAAEKLHACFPTRSEHWVLLKGGHLPGDELVDLLFNGDRMLELPSARIRTRHTHGTGCALSSAIAALLPQRSGQINPVEAAVRDAQAWLYGAIRHAETLQVGQGNGPVHHFYGLWKQV